MSDNRIMHELGLYLKENRYILSWTEFARKINKCRSCVSDVKKGNRDITEQFAYSIVQAFPFINIDWLLTGEGAMIKEETIPEYKEKYYMLLEENRELRLRIDKQNEEIERLRQ